MDHRRIRRPSPSLASLDDDGTSSEESTEKLGKIWLACSYAPQGEQGVFSYGGKGAVNNCLFLVDLDGNEGDYGFVPRNPDLCLSYTSLGVSELCIVGSTLYLFGIGKRLFKYELPSSSSCSSTLLPLPLPRVVATLTSDLLTDCCPMNFRKYHPMACPTPDGKRMIVLSFYLNAMSEDCGKFELFDPAAKQEWRVLPDLLPLVLSQNTSHHRILRYSHPKTCICVCSYSFIDNGDVFLVVTTVGNFTLNIQQRGCQWSKFDELQFPTNEYSQLVLVRDCLCLTDWFAWVGGGARLSSYPDLSLEIFSCRRNIGSGIAWLSSNAFCVARSYVDFEKRQPHLSIDVWSIDSLARFHLWSFDSDALLPHVEPYGMMSVPNLKLVKRFKFVLGPQSENWVEIFAPNCLSPIP